MDIVGPFPVGPSGKKFLIVAVEYFSKWVEAEATASISENKVMDFLWKLSCRFGLPRILVADNGRQFSGYKLKDWCEEMGIEQRFTSIGYPQANGQTEVTNRTIVDNLQKRLGDAKKDWVDELEGVLWAYRTTARTATQETPFSLVYGSEVVIPFEISINTFRIQGYVPSDNHDKRVYDLNMLETKRSTALARTLGYQAIMARAYNKHVKSRDLQIGDLVLRKADILKPTGKLEPNSQGPYRVTRACINGSYALESMDGKPLKRTWNAKNLQKYYA